MWIIDKIKDIIFKAKDYDRLESDYSSCLCYFTNNRLSKTNYEINGLITVICDTIGEYIDEGYNHAKEEFALTWQDIELIVNIDKDTNNEEALNTVRKNEEHYREVLKRFNETRESSK